MSVTRHRGAPASGHAGYRGEGQFTAIQFGPILIPHQTETIHHTSAIITSAPVRIGNSSASSSRSNRLARSHLRSGVAALVASNSLARPSLAGAGRATFVNQQ